MKTLEFRRCLVKYPMFLHIAASFCVHLSLRGHRAVSCLFQHIASTFLCLHQLVHLLLDFASLYCSNYLLFNLFTCSHCCLSWVPSYYSKFLLFPCLLVFLVLSALYFLLSFCSKFLLFTFFLVFSLLTVLCSFILQQVSGVHLPAGVLTTVCIAAGWGHPVEFLGCLPANMAVEADGGGRCHCRHLHLVEKPPLQVSVWGRRCFKC